MNRFRTPSPRVLWLVLGIVASIGICVGIWLAVWAPPRRLSDAISATNPRWSPTGAYVLADCAFHFDPWVFGDEAYEVCLAQPDLSGLVRLAPNYTYRASLEATWSPDGTEVVFLNPQGGLLVSSVQPNTTRLLTSTPCEAPDWSPDGRQISCIDNDHNLVLVHVGTGAITPLTTMGDVYTPHWVRDGQAIAFVKAAGIGLQRHDVYDLYVLDLLTQHEHRLVANLGTLPPLTISPDGTQLAYPNAPAPGLIVLDIATGAREDILTPPCLDTIMPPAWSPDGHYLAFVTEMRGSYDNGQVYMVDVHNHTVVQVTNFAEKANVELRGMPTWAPDGTALAIATREHIVVAPIDSSQFIPVRCP